MKEAGLVQDSPASAADKIQHQISITEVDILFKQYALQKQMTFDKFLACLAHVAYVCLGCLEAPP